MHARVAVFKMHAWVASRTPPAIMYNLVSTPYPTRLVGFVIIYLTIYDNKVFMGNLVAVH